MEDIEKEADERDLEALNNYQESRKRPRSACSSPLSDVVSDSTRTKKEKIDETSWKPTESVWENDPSGLYGLKPDYLRILGIEPPICNWICVENFRCDKSELREVLELAGYVVVCSLFFNKLKHAKVMYSHPLEAVQAVSMFNKQMFYGSALSVTMMKYPVDSIILPKGLTDVGPGFGAYGKPLRDIVKHFERFVKKEPHSINTLLFYDPNDPRDDEEMKPPGSVESDDSEKAKDVHERFQFSKQYPIRHLDDDIEDSKSETDSKKNNSYTENIKTSPKTASLPKYSPRSPTRSPFTEEKCMNIAKRDDGPKKLQHSFSSNNLVQRTTFASNTSNNVNLSRPIMGPSSIPVRSMRPIPNPSYPNNSLLPTPTAMQRPMIGPNAPIHVGPRVGPIAPIAGPISALGFRPSGHVNGSGFRPNGPFNNPGIRPNVPMGGPVSGPTSGPMGPVLTPNPGPSSGLLPAPRNTLQFRNLPPTTTFALLSQKMAECGQVLSVQLSATPGCATVMFAHPTHAQRCFRIL